MALPPGVTTCVVTFGSPASGFGGEDVSTTLTITPSHSVYHAATGAPLLAFTLRAEAGEGLPGSVTLPHTDQAGFLDAAGNAFSNWAYTAEGSWRSGGNSIAFKKNFQLPTGQTVIDLDLVPNGTIDLPVTAPTATVTSFLGKTGPIEEEDLADLELGGGVADEGVTTEKLAPTAVTGPKIASDAVSRSKLAPAVRTELDGLLTKTDAANSYAPLGGAALPAGGTPGQALTKTESGAGWSTISGGASTVDALTDATEVGKAVAKAADAATARTAIGATDKITTLGDVAAVTGATLARNEFVNPDSEGVATLASDLNASCAISTNAFSGWPTSGTKSHRVANIAAGGYRVILPNALRPSASAGQVWSVEMTIYNPAAASRQFTTQLMGFDTAGTARGASVSAVATIAAGASARIRHTFTVPATTPVVDKVAFDVSSLGAGGATTGDAFYIDDIDLYQGASTRPHVSGGQARSYWTGTPHASPSVEVPANAVTVPVDRLSDATTVGKALAKAVDAPTARTAIGAVDKIAVITNLAAATSKAMARNEHPNPDAIGALTFVSDAAAACTISADSFAGWPLSGTRSHKIANAGSAGFRAILPLAQRPAATPGQVWTVEFTIYNAAPGARQFGSNLMGYDTVPASHGLVASPTWTIPANTALRVSHSFTLASSTPASTMVAFDIASKAAGGAAAGDAFYLGNIDLYQGSGTRSHMSGNQSSSYFTGAENASPSVGLPPGSIFISEGALVFTDPRVGGVADPSPSSTIDNTIALNRAYTMLAANGGELFAPRGIYPQLTAPNAQPGGVWLTGEGYDYSTPSDTSRPVRGTVFRALAPMTHLIRLGTAPGLGPGQTGASVRDISLDGNNLADSTLWAVGSRNKVHNTQVYSGLLRAALLAGQNVHFTDSVFAQDNVGDVITVTGPLNLDNKIWTSQIRSPGPTGAAVRILGGVATDIQMSHLWAGGGGVPRAAQALIVIESTSTQGIINTLIEGNTIEGVIGPEILIDAISAVSSTGINSNKFYMNTNAQDDLYPIVQLKSGVISGLSFDGNTTAGDGAANRYKSVFHLEEAVTGTGGFVIGVNPARFAKAFLTGKTPPQAFEFAANQIHNGTEWLRTNNRGTATFTGDGTQTVFSIPHKLVAAPAAAIVNAGSPAATAPSYTVWDATNIIVTFTTAPANGATVKLNWNADC